MMFNLNVRSELAQAMYDLLSHTPVNEITTGQITAACGLSRRTFYNYFRDKYDLMHFIFYTRLEQLWFKDGNPCRFDVAYRRHLHYESISMNVLKNMYSYVGQNDIRNVQVRITAYNLRRMFYYNHAKSYLHNKELNAMIELIAYGLTSMFEQRVFNSSVFVPDPEVVVSCFPPEYRDIIMKDPMAEGPRSDIPSFDPLTCEWPPEYLTIRGTVPMVFS